MQRLGLLLGTLLFFCIQRFPPQNSAAAGKPRPLQAGSVLSSVSTTAHPEQSYALYLDCFRLAADADPDSTWALDNLAATRALTGDRKGALEALRRAKEKSKDPAAFSAWLRSETAFAKLREDAQFRAFLEESAKHR